MAKTNAEALVKAAQAELDGAKAQLSAAQTRVEQIEASLAQAHVLDLVSESTVTQVGLERAQIALDDTQDEYNKALDRPWENQAIRDAWAKKLTQAQLDYRLAQAQLDEVWQCDFVKAVCSNLVLSWTPLKEIHRCH
ncbi:MAG: hypothetical protein JXA89_15375 [Anaerolineae bacterium]|nr:hypothetical protein [Anaerolineae bacterium]